MPVITRRLLLAAAATSLLGAACTTASQRTRADRIVELSSGRELTPAGLLADVEASDFALLGEQHDNLHHHTLRAALLAALRPGAAVVAEHLPLGARVQPAGNLLASLEAAGFEAEAWSWPSHEALFSAAVRARLSITGGDIDRELARRIAREGLAVVPPDLAAVIAQAPLDVTARQTLDATLVASHCGHLPASRIEPMRWAQRARDAAMWQALQACGGRPAVLLAGNGHVRRDHGVPQLIAALRPDARLVCVGLIETGDAPEVLDAGRHAPYTHAWITPGVDREDPCKTFRAR